MIVPKYIPWVLYVLFIYDVIFVFSHVILILHNVGDFVLEINPRRVDTKDLLCCRMWNI